MRTVAILASHNRREFTLSCLESLYAQDSSQNRVEVVLTDDEQSSVYSEYANDVGFVDTDMMTDIGSYRHNEITVLERNFVAGTQINLNSRRLNNEPGGPLKGERHRSRHRCDRQSTP